MRRVISSFRISHAFVILFCLAFLVGYANAAQNDADQTIPGEPGALKKPHIPYVKAKIPLQAPALNLNISQIEVSEFPTIKVYAQVTDENGQEITGLATSNFTLTEQKEDETAPVQEQIAVEEMAVETTVKVAIIIDSSGSMNEGLVAAKDGARAFIGNMGILGGTLLKNSKSWKQAAIDSVTAAV